MSTPFKDRKPPTDSEIREYFGILKNDPKSRVFAPLAEALIRRGRLQEAEQLCIHGVEKNPHFSDGHLAYSRVLFYLFRYKDALNEVKKTLALDSSNIEAYLIAAEIFLSRSQHKATSDACMKALDLDPTNAHALQILKKINTGAEDDVMDEGRFSTVAGTAPSKKRLDKAKGPAMTNPFEQLMHELHVEGERLLEDEQPFTALSSGSNVNIPVFDEDDEFGQDQEFTQPTQPIPKLPAHPPTPAPVKEPVLHQAPVIDKASPARPKKQNSKSNHLDDILSQVPNATPAQSKAGQSNAAQSEPIAQAQDSSRHRLPATHEPGSASSPGQKPAFSSQSQITAWQRIDAAQRIIDSYSDRIAPPYDGPPPKFSSWMSTLSFLGFMLAISSVVIALVYLMSMESQKPPMPEKRGYKIPASMTKPQKEKQGPKDVESRTQQGTGQEIKTAEMSTAQAEEPSHPEPTEVDTSQANPKQTKAQDQATKNQKSESPKLTKSSKAKKSRIKQRRKKRRKRRKTRRPKTRRRARRKR